jgi:exodeoxyribonuclease-3
MIIATWNVNSIRVRLPILLDWLKRVSPDVVLLQELKCENSAFPALEIESLGYHALIKGQKAYNGVAILSKERPVLLRDILPGETGDAQARYIEAEIGGVTIASIYLPNGNPLGTEKFSYKLGWMDKLYSHAQGLLAQEKPVVLAGDFNVIPEPQDARHPEKWTGDALFQPESRASFRRFTHMGYTEAFRSLHPDTKDAYTFWDYQAGAWDRDDGIRIDHFLLSPEATDRLQECTIDRDMRGLEKASDHVPVLVTLAP